GSATCPRFRTTGSPSAWPRSPNCHGAPSWSRPDMVNGARSPGSARRPATSRTRPPPWSPSAAAHPSTPTPPRSPEHTKGLPPMRYQRTSRRKVVPLLLAATTVAGIAACSSGGTPAAGPTTGQVTLVAQNGDGGETGLLAGYAKLNSEFEAAHPGVTIRFVTKNFTDLVNTLKLQLSGSNPPDITQVNQGYSS